MEDPRAGPISSVSLPASHCPALAWGPAATLISYAEAKSKEVLFWEASINLQPQGL